MSDLKLVQIAFIDAATSYLPPPFNLLWCHSVGGREKKSCCCCVCSFPSHFTQIQAHGRRDLLAIFWVFMKTLPHFQSRKKRPLVCVSLRPQIRISHIPKWKQKARPLPKKIVISRSYCTQHRRMRWGSSRMWDPVSRGRGGFLPFRRTRAAKYKQHVGLFRLFSEAAWWRSSCLIHRWPWSTKCLARRGKPRRSSHSLRFRWVTWNVMARNARLAIGKKRQMHNLKCVYFPKTTYLSH